MNITILFHRRFAAGTLLFSTHKVSSYTDLLLSECLPHKMLEGGFRRPLQASAHPNQHYLSDITVCAQLNFFLFHPIGVLLVIGIFFEMEGGETKYARLLLLGAPTVTDSFRCASTFGPSTQYKYIYRSHVHIFEWEAMILGLLRWGFESFPFVKVFHAPEIWWIIYPPPIPEFPGCCGRSTLHRSILLSLFLTIWYFISFPLFLFFSPSPS